MSSDAQADNEKSPSGEGLFMRSGRDLNDLSFTPPETA